MGDVIAFSQPKLTEPLVWQCSCGSVAFRLHSDGSIVCRECKRESETARVMWPLMETA